MIISHAKEFFGISRLCLRGLYFILFHFASLASDFFGQHFFFQMETHIPVPLQKIPRTQSFPFSSGDEKKLSEVNFIRNNGFLFSSNVVEI